MTDCAPIVLFVFNRPEHTAQTLQALAGNPLADDSDLFIYSDAARSEDDAALVREVRRVVHAADGFRSVTIVEREVNYGLARNIVDGVSAACERYGRVIVLEDDIVTEPSFLRFMNSALIRYAEEPKVWHISGWNYPMTPLDQGSAYFWRVMNCWGWATWNDRWRHFRKSPESILCSWTMAARRRFNVEGAYQFFAQIVANSTGDRNTWAVFWYATIFEHAGLCLTTSRSLVRNIGADGSGTHGARSAVYDVLKQQELSEHSVETVWNTQVLPTEIIESEAAIRCLRDFYRENSGTSDKMSVLASTYLPICVQVTLRKLRQNVRWIAR